MNSENKQLGTLKNKDTNLNHNNQINNQVEDLKILIHLKVYISFHLILIKMLKDQSQILIYNN